MKTSLVSREVIADSIELVARGHYFDALVALSGCDKTIPGCVMALARLDLPSLMLYGGSIAPGRWRGKDVTIQDVFEAVGAHAAGDMADDELEDLVDHASPGPGACAGQFTANTMAMAFEVLASRPAPARWCRPRTATKGDVAEACGRLVMDAGGGRPPPERRDHQGRRSRTRSPPRHVGRLDQRGPPPAGRGQRGRRASSTSTTSTASPGARRCSPTSSRAGASWPPTSTRPAACRW